LDLWLGRSEKLACSEQLLSQNYTSLLHKTNQFPASPNSHFQYINMKMIDACEGVILPIWFELGWICGW
jgi:hypothetical protein